MKKTLFFYGLLYFINFSFCQETKINEKSVEFKNILSLYNKAELHNKSNNYNKAAEIYQTIITKFEAEFGTNHNYYGLFLNNLAQVYADDKQLNKAFQLFTEAKRNTQNTLGKTHSRYGFILESLAYVCQRQEKFEESVNYAKLAIENIEDNFGQSSVEYAFSQITLGSSYYLSDKVTLALPLMIEASKTLEKQQLIKDPEYHKALNTIGLCYKDLGQYEKAIQFYEKAVRFDENNVTYLRNLALAYLDTYKVDEALSLLNKALHIVKSNKGENSEDYAFLISTMGSLYKQIGQSKKAKKHYKESLQIIESTLGKKHSEYASAQGNLATIHTNLKEYDSALVLRKQSLKLTEDIYGKQHFSYTISLNNLIYTLTHMGKYEDALPYLKEQNDLVKKELETSFAFLNQKERVQFFKNNTGQRLDDLLHFNFETNNKYPEVSSLAINNILTRKSLLLNTSKTITNKLKALNDNTISQKIEELSQLRQEVNKTKKGDASALQTRINALESDLLKSYNENFEKVKLSKDFRKNKLQKNEIAIEFKRFVHYPKNSLFSEIQYVAYLYQKNSKTPTVINLFKEKELRKFLVKTNDPNQLYKTRGALGKTKRTFFADSIYNLVWQPLEKHLIKTKTIYFAPDGLLHKIPFAALPDSNNTLLCEKYSLNQMGNTADIIERHTTPNKSDALFIGGIDYNFNPDGKKQLKSNSFSELNADDLLGSEKNKALNTKNGTWSYLSGTLDEINTIANQFPKSKILSKKEATETAFKALSGNSPIILHIATHGYFFPEKYCDKDNEEDCIRERYTEAKNPLLRSGLIFANANYAWQNGGNPYEEDDGILTALEISNLDLSNTDLVVLSACETGLGDIEGSEGVYGLQRAFKMAGVKTIIMSLWEVPDAETAEFMKLFYSNWIDTNDYKLAFKTAQKTMMQKYRNDPDKWAAFVLFE